MWDLFWVNGGGIGRETHTFQAVFQAVLHHDEELLEWCIVGVECSSQVESRLDEAFDAQFGHVHQVKPFDGDGILWIWKGRKKSPPL